ncbi:unnamed protein product [Arabidopsis halleri]
MVKIEINFRFRPQPYVLRRLPPARATTTLHLCLDGSVFWLSKRHLFVSHLRRRLCMKHMRHPLVSTHESDPSSPSSPVNRTAAVTVHLR